MTRPVIRLLPPALIGLIAIVVMARMTMLTIGFTDYEAEVLPSLSALLSGHVSDFLSHLPAYGGSVILRAPFAFVTHAFGGSDLDVFHAMALPCLIAALVFGLVLWGQLAGPRGRAGIAAWLALAVVVANPATIQALDTGHPEELLGGVLCAGAVLAALRDRPVWAGVLLGLAGANKAWAVFAIVPVLIGLRERRHIAVLTAAGVCAIVVAPMFLVGSQSAAADAATATGSIFQPWQLWWFVGSHGAAVHGLYEAKIGYRTGPGWVSEIAHPVVVIVPLLLGVVAALRGRRQDALLLLAACLLARCVLDPWNTGYYQLPFLMALAAHESVIRHRAPVGAIAASACVYAMTALPGTGLSADGQAAFYLAWSLPALTGMTLALLAPARLQALTAPLVRVTKAQLPALSKAFAAPPAV